MNDTFSGISEKIFRLSSLSISRYHTIYGILAFDKKKCKLQCVMQHKFG